MQTNNLDYLASAQINQMAIGKPATALTPIEDAQDRTLDLVSDLIHVISAIIGGPPDSGAETGPNSNRDGRVGRLSDHADLVSGRVKLASAEVERLALAFGVHPKKV